MSEAEIGQFLEREAGGLGEKQREGEEGEVRDQKGGRMHNTSGSGRLILILFWSPLWMPVKSYSGHKWDGAS